MRASALLLAAVLALCPGAAAQTPAATLDAAERLQDAAPDSALRLVSDVLRRGTGDAALANRAQRLRCWIAPGAAPDSVLAFAVAGLAHARRTADPAAAADLHACRGYGLEQAGRNTEALADYDLAIREGRRLGAAPVVAQALVLRGELRHGRGDFAGAGRDLAEAHRTQVRLGNRAQTQYALNAMANLYADPRVAQYPAALTYYRQVLEAHRAAGSLQGMATAHYNLGATLERMSRLGEALAQYRRGLALDQRRGDAGEVAVDRRSIGIVLYKMGRTRESLAVLEQALAHFRRAGDAEYIAQTRLSRGVALRLLGRADAALEDLDAAQSHFAAADNPAFMEKVHEERALALAALGQWADAYEARSQQLAVQRMLGDRARDEQSARLRVQFDAERKDEENRALLRENALRGTAIAAGVRVRRLQVAVLALGAAVIAALGLLAVRQVAAARRLRALALSDELTGLPNRRHLHLLAAARMSAAEPLAVLALDVDRFKHINDTHGHDAGDQVLRRVALACRAVLGPGDHLGRTGGEEFTALLPGATLAAAAALAERMRAAVAAAELDAAAPGLRATVSIGVAARTPRDTEFARLLKRADDALYRAKADGRNRVAAAE